MAPRSACDCSTVNTGGCVTVACAMPRLVRYANNSLEVTGMRGSGAVTWGYRFGAPMLQSRTPFGIRSARRLPYRRVFGCECSSGVEHDLAKVGVEGSNPFARSSFTFVQPGDIGDRTYLRHGWQPRGRTGCRGIDGESLPAQSGLSRECCSAPSF